MGVIEEILTDWKHYVGWGISTVAIVLLFHLLGVHSVHTPWYRVIYLFAVIVVIDLMKHATELQ